MYDLTLIDLGVLIILKGRQNIVYGSVVYLITRIELYIFFGISVHFSFNASPIRL
jgi:hypothetical protein